MRLAAQLDHVAGEDTWLALNLLFSSGDQKARHAARSRLLLTLPLAFDFAMGASAGAAGYLLASFWTLLLPLAALCVLAVLPRKTGAP